MVFWRENGAESTRESEEGWPCQPCPYISSFKTTFPPLKHHISVPLNPHPKSPCWKPPLRVSHGCPDLAFLIGDWESVGGAQVSTTDMQSFGLCLLERSTQDEPRGETLFLFFSRGKETETSTTLNFKKSSSIKVSRNVTMVTSTRLY